MYPQDKIYGGYKRGKKDQKWVQIELSTKFSTKNREFSTKERRIFNVSHNDKRRSKRRSKDTV